MTAINPELEEIEAAAAAANDGGSEPYPPERAAYWALFIFALSLVVNFLDRGILNLLVAPIVSPMNCPWGEKALGGYLGPDRAAWREYDACALIEDGARAPEILVDQGEADLFLESQLKPELLEAACARAGVKLTLRRQAGYDHSYYFISTFIEDHLRWHAERLGA